MLWCLVALHAPERLLPFLYPPSSTGLAVGFSQQVFETNENSMEAVFEVVVFGTTERQILLQFTTANASATGEQFTTKQFDCFGQFLERVK